MMKYMLLTYLDEKAWLALSTEQQGRNGQVRAARRSAGRRAEGSRTARRCTRPARRRRSRRGQGKRLVTDGPFAETREQLGGYTLIEAADLDEAIAIAAGFMTDATLASIEVWLGGRLLARDDGSAVVTLGVRT